MNQIRVILKYCIILICLLIGFYLFFYFGKIISLNNFDEFCSSYDAVMKWVNFSIIIGMLLKYGYHPLKNFTQSQKNNEDHLNKLREKIISEGKIKCSSIISQAMQQSSIMLENVKKSLKFI